MKSYNEELDQAKLLMRCIVRGYDFFVDKERAIPKGDQIIPSKLILEFLQHDMEEIRKFGKSRGKRSNGGQECDIDNGPCACGAWHTPENISAEQLIYPEDEVVRLRKILYGK